MTRRSATVEYPDHYVDAMFGFDTQPKNYGSLYDCYNEEANFD